MLFKENWNTNLCGGLQACIQTDIPGNTMLCGGLPAMPTSFYSAQTDCPKSSKTSPRGPVNGGLAHQERENFKNGLWYGFPQ